MRCTACWRVLRECRVCMLHVLHLLRWWGRRVNLRRGQNQPLLRPRHDDIRLGSVPNRLLSGLLCHVSPTQSPHARLHMWWCNGGCCGRHGRQHMLRRCSVVGMRNLPRLRRSGLWRQRRL